MVTEPMFMKKTHYLLHLAFLTSCADDDRFVPYLDIELNDRSL